MSLHLSTAAELGRLFGELAHERQQKVSQLDAVLIQSTQNQRCRTNLV